MADEPASRQIARGQYDTPDGHYSRRIYRHFFLHRAGVLVPDLLPSLAEAITPLSREVFDLSDLDFSDVEAWWAGAARFNQFLAAVDPWLGRWHLADDWVVQESHGPLCRVTGNPTSEERVRGAWALFKPDGRPFSPIYPPTGEIPTLAKPLPPLFTFSARWYPQYELRADILRSVRERFEEELDGYLDGVEDQMRAAGLAKIPAKRSRRGRDAMRHFDWLVRFQVEGWPYTKVAARVGADVRQVERAVCSTARLIGLTRRTEPAHR